MFQFNIYLSHEAELSGDAKLKDAQACPESAKCRFGDRKPGNGIRGPISRRERSRGDMYEDKARSRWDIFTLNSVKEAQ